MDIELTTVLVEFVKELTQLIKDVRKKVQEEK